MNIAEELFSLLDTAGLNPCWEHGGTVLTFTVDGETYWTGYASWTDAGREDENGHYWLVDIGLEQDEADEEKILDCWATALGEGIVPINLAEELKQMEGTK